MYIYLGVASEKQADGLLVSQASEQELLLAWQNISKGETLTTLIHSLTFRSMGFAQVLKHASSEATSF